MRTTTTLTLTAVLLGLFLTVAHAADVPRPTWKNLSSKTGDLQAKKDEDHLEDDSR